MEGEVQKNVPVTGSRRLSVWVRRVLVILLVLTGLLVISLLWYSYASQPRISGVLHVDGLHRPVSITRDRNAVPHIVAQSRRDAAFALGFVHAQDRLWQLQMHKRIVGGRMAEILGPGALDTDRFLRTLGIRRNAEAIWAHSPPEVREIFQAYADGINASIAGRTGPLPPEFLILGTTPEMWEPTDSIGWQTMMAWDLGGNWTQEVLRMQLAQHLPLARIEQLLPPYPGDAPLPTRDYVDLYRSMAPMAAVLAETEAAAPSSYVEGKGSNNWVIAGSRSATGKPMLANDPHLGLQAPALWYFAHLSTPDGNVVGASLPGLPVIVIGRNDRIAWGFTNTAPDVQDLYLERVDPAAPGRYQTPRGWAAFGTRTETIRVKGQEDVVLQVRETRHGPVISDVAVSARDALGKMKERYVVAFQWTALLPDDATALAGIRINQARNWASFVDAVQYFHAPQQNMVYADVDGNIGFIAPARVPRRKAGNDLHGLVPAPGWDARYDWDGFIPFAALPRVFNPPEGLIVTANQKIVPNDYPYFITSEWVVPYRSDRIRALLQATPKHTSASFARIQGDLVSPSVHDLLPLLLASPDMQADRLPAPQREMREMLARWNHDMRPELAEPLVATAWLRELSRTLFEDRLGEALFLKLWDQRNLQQATLNLLRDEAGIGAYWCRGNVPETPEKPEKPCAAAIRTAWDAAWLELEQRYGSKVSSWKWGEAHAARSEHKPFGRVGWLAGLFDVTVPTGGDTYSINVGGHSVRNRQAPFANTHAASLRAIVDLAHHDRSGWMHATGQSGHVLSSHYRDWASKWAEIGSVPISVYPASYTNGALGTLVLEPVK